MLSRLVDKLNLRERAIARPPLAQLLQWLLVRACRPYENRIAAAWMVEAIKVDVLRQLHEIADAGALRYFGIRNAEEFGSPEIRVRMHDPAGRGVLLIDGSTLTAWILGGGDGSHGWRSTRDFNFEET